jgi:NitT/TauT family transport system substrate-binding protein
LKRALALLLLAAACSKPAPETARPLTKVTLNVNPTMTYAPLMIAKDEGFFAQEGIDARFVSLDPNSAVAAAATGQLDVLSAGIRSGVFNMMLKGVPLQIVADKGRSAARTCSAEAFIAPVAMARRIAANGGNPRGERLAFIRGGTAEFVTVRMLEQHGLKLADMEVVQLPQGTAATSHDNIDAIRYTTEPNLSDALAEGWASTVVETETVAPGHQTAVLLYGKRLLRDDPELGRRFMRAYLRGVRRYNEGKTDRNVAIVSRHTKLPPAILRRACWITIAPDGRIDPAAVQPFLDWALTQHYLDASVPMTTWWNGSFVNAAGR